VDPRVSSGTIDTFHVAAYGGGHIGDIALRTGAAYSHHDVATSRIIAFPGSGDFAAAKYGASTSQVFGEAAYRLGRNATSADLFANIAHVRVHSDGFGETGGPAALNVAQADTSSTFTTLGARAQAPIGIIATSALTAKGVLGWQHAFDATAPVSLMSFATSPSPFAITGVPIAADSVLVEAGLDAALPHDMVVGLLYSSRLASTASDHALKANFGMRF
jgi:outer membrane autotransporter protein